MSGLGFRREDAASEGNSVKDRGNIALKIASVDMRSGTVTGYDANYPNGDEITIRMAKVDDFASLYVNRNIHTTQGEREAEAKRQMAKQPQFSDFRRHNIRENDIVQFQSVKELPDGNLVARWYNALTTYGQEMDAHRRVMMQINIPKDNESTANKFPRRLGRAFDLDGTVPASRDSLSMMVDSKVRRDDGSALEGSMRNSVLISITDGVDVKAQAVDLGWNRDEKRPGAGIKEFFQGAKADFYSAMPLAALAGKVGYGVENIALKGPGERGGFTDVEAAREQMREMAARAAAGDVGVAITPGWAGDLMLHAKNDAIEREKMQREGGRGISLSERGFFLADVAFMSSPEKTNDKGDVYPAQSAFKAIYPAEFLHKTTDERFVRRNVTDIGTQAMSEAVERDKAAIFAPRADHKREAGPASPEVKEPEKSRGNEMSPGGAY